ncbi:hypothetical protein [Desulfitobacterium sp. LBE]|uniref:hypothetical protein n=1 Tax=Desulfitobacterium sp. LBE TaxID=884086 RepID=UPI001FA9CCC1|nr:hypothetical protein [Desulfitobacterium sp. LBE]
MMKATACSGCGKKYCVCCQRYCISAKMKREERLMEEFLIKIGDLANLCGVTV